MAVSNELIEYVQAQLLPWREISVRKMFGGAGLYCDSVMFALIADDIVYLKVDETNKEKYYKLGTSIFKPYANRPAIPSFLKVPEEIFLSSEDFIEWAKESLLIQKKRK